MKNLNNLIEKIKIFGTCFMGFFIVNFFYSPFVFALGEDNNSDGRDPDGLGGWMGIILSVSFYLILISLDLVRTQELNKKENNSFPEQDPNLEEDLIIEKFDLNFLNFKLFNLKTNYLGEEQNIILNFFWAHWEHIIHSIALLGGGLIYHHFNKISEKKNKTNKKTPEENMDSNKQVRDLEYEKKLQKFKDDVKREKQIEQEFDDACWEEFSKKNEYYRRDSKLFENYKKKKRTISSNTLIQDRDSAPVDLNSSLTKKK